MFIVWFAIAKYSSLYSKLSLGFSMLLTQPDKDNFPSFLRFVSCTTEDYDETDLI
ncbi:hypothetical protein N474_06420 [Pseudoalteromonas luteoviolacea CPMOR-2]|uniref:Uncharacterized protein n=1 Tax=Pseudoalteromonas luteoviolacea DSM 6061 TaxID=1365250 RepID=A0A166YEI7_9GAMM|nr:hypothetical protein N475_09530 [Pseudoalteromonas luteoviolacea DSM 6061]KZN60027.1 hypothetical protein N474_06420 [Pseudoalteromonas luteoviolacea CPMOR-2]MBE0385247.1 hypothetical protein [Pseudoalteromonas luteoviolacea DSM 6061]